MWAISKMIILGSTSEKHELVIQQTISISASKRRKIGFPSTHRFKCKFKLRHKEISFWIQRDGIWLLVFLNNIFVIKKASHSHFLIQALIPTACQANSNDWNLPIFYKSKHLPSFLPSHSWLKFISLLVSNSFLP